MEQKVIPIVQVEHLCKKFCGFEIKDVSFTMEAGYILGLIGRNGAGKTTLMRLLQNVIPKKSGTITINGQDSVKNEVEVKNSIGFIMENPFFDNLSIEQNGRYFGMFYQEYNHDKFLSFINKFHLNAKQEVGKLSKGMETKFQLAFALSHNAKLLIMDEPTGGLDPIFRREFLSLLQQVVEEEAISVIISTHITSDLDKIADYITMIDQGELVFFQTKEELFDTYSLVKGSRELLQRIPKSNFVSVRKYDQGFVGLTQQPKEIERLIKDSDSVVFERASIEDIMYYISKERSELV